MIFDELVEKVKEFEGFSSKAYKDPGGTLTIGYGRITDVNIGEITTPEYETEWLFSKLTEIYNRVSAYCEGYNLTNNQLLALTDFTFNLGFGNLKKLTANNTRTIEDIAEHIPLYNKCAGKELRGLTTRRRWELNLFTTWKNEKSNEQQLQQLINLFLTEHGSETRIKEDGIIGRKTVNALHEVFSLI